MSIPIIAFFSNQGGVGKTSLVYQLSHMFDRRGLRVIAADLDPQCSLTATFLDEDRLEELMPPNKSHPQTVFGSMQSIQRGIGDISDPHVEVISDRLGLIPGDMSLSTFEEQLCEAWPRCLERDERSFRVMSAFYTIVQSAAKKHGTDVILMDLGPNLGAINRAALIASNFVVIPLLPDLFSLQGLQNLGPALRRWREEWKERLARNPVVGPALPPGTIKPIGYTVLRHSIRLDRPLKAFDRWIAGIPSVYAESILEQQSASNVKIETDPNCLVTLKDYRSLILLAQEARKPMFSLKPADGALGAYTYAVADAFKDFSHLAVKIGAHAGLKDYS